MYRYTLEPSSSLLSEEYVLVQAWKKAHTYIRNHNWYSDCLELDLVNADIERHVNSIADEMESEESLVSQPLRLVLAPKSQKWNVKKNKWVPEEGVAAVQRKLRPLAHVTARDQIISTTFMMLLADLVEQRQGDPRRSPVAVAASGVSSYGNRLFCDVRDEQLSYRWANSNVYRKYFQDYQSFVARPMQVVADRFEKNDESWAVVSLDLAQFYDRIRPQFLHSKVEILVRDQADQQFLDKFKSFMKWKWFAGDQKEAMTYAKGDKSRGSIIGFEEIALPQGLVASGFFANVCLLDFDDAVVSLCGGHADDWELLDYSRYVDDLRLVVRLGESLVDKSEKEIADLVEKKLNELLQRETEGLFFNTEKSTVVLGRDSGAGAIKISSTIDRINRNVSGAIDQQTGAETLDLIDGLFSTRVGEALDFEDTQKDTFFSAKPDVADQTADRFSANRFRKVFRSLRPITDEVGDYKGNPILAPGVTREDLDNKAAYFSRRLIEKWVRDPSNVRLLRVALDVFPDPKSLRVVLPFITDCIAKRRNGPKRVGAYCLAELLKAAATETGFVHDQESLPKGASVDEYREIILDTTKELANKDIGANPWYLEQQAWLYLACIGDYRDRQTKSPHLSHYFELHQALANRPEKIREVNLLPMVLLVARIKSVSAGAELFVNAFGSKKAPTQRRMLARILVEDELLAEEIYLRWSSEDKETWKYLFINFGLLHDKKFPTTVDELSDGSGEYSFIDVARSPVNPFQQEEAAIELTKVLLAELTETKREAVSPASISIEAESWRALWYDKFPILQNLTVRFGEAEGLDVRFAVPDWAKERRWAYQLGLILRCLLTGRLDYSSKVQAENTRGVIYLPYRSNWLNRRYGHFSGREAFGPPSVPISSWFGSLICRLLEWPGFTRQEVEIRLDDDFSPEDLLAALNERADVLQGLYGKLSSTPVLPISIPPSFTEDLVAEDSEGSYQLQVGVAQTVIPRFDDFAGDVPLNNAGYRRKHRRHLSSVIGGVHRMLQVRQSHEVARTTLDLLVLPELSVHIDDVKTVLVPFARQHRCIVFAGTVFHSLLGSSDLCNTAYWIIPFESPQNGLQINIVEQGKWNMTKPEIAGGIRPFRPAQWKLDFTTPTLPYDRLWSVSGSICFDATDLSMAADLRDLTELYLVPALNRDVGTFDNMVSALHYHMFQHMVIANSGEFGGSTAQAPFREAFKRTIFHNHGGEQATVSFFGVDMGCYRQTAAKTVTNKVKLLKSSPAGFCR